VSKFWVLVMALVFICGCDVNPAERNNAGNTLYEQGQYDSALAAYQAAQVVSPDSPEAYYNAASAYGQKGEYDKAIAALQQALKTTDVELKTRAYFNLGNIYFQMQRFDDAVESYQQALIFNPNDDDARHNLELAIKRLVVPTPTPVSPSDQPTDEGNDGITPTSELPNQPSATTSATAAVTAHPDSLTPIPDSSELSATISVDDAQGILDAVQQAQQSLPNPLLPGTPSAVNSGKDW
jgi:tetratricopeptide (TPR) repeat protein